ncbi:hypothetical protein ElyMa_002003800 [Elysia marginata]|uniref:GOLD domain-containing protein n=1 Tax=Elysia marginata TaxID=1093978 RepID=A0AAV4F487_9GAST|nr:hypothetical protein ElyMa_002003800 [Elysia marginata]
MKRMVLFAGCLVQVQAVSAAGVEGQIILGIFIPLTIIVLAVCLGRACWTWYLTHSLDEWAYDPYLDLALRTKYPAHIEPPLSSGRIVHSVGHIHKMLNSNFLNETSSAPMCSLALATHNIGCAMASNPHPPIESQAQQLIAAPKTKDSRPETKSCSIKSAPIPKNLTSLDATFSTDVSDWSMAPLHSSPQESKSFVPLFCPAIGSPPSNSAIEHKEEVSEKIKRPSNPYGMPAHKSRKTTHSTSSGRTPSVSGSFGESSATNFPLSSFTGLQPRFATFVKIKWARFYDRFCRLRQGRFRAPRLTSRDLQHDVKVNEEQMLFSISALRDQLLSSHLSTSSGSTGEEFELGPVSVPLWNIRPSSQKTGRFKNEREERCLYHTRPGMYRFQFLSDLPKATATASQAKKNNANSDPATIFEVKKKTSCRIKLVNSAVRGREQVYPKQNIVKSASEATLSDDEDFNENCTANFEELFAMAEERQRSH